MLTKPDSEQMSASFKPRLNLELECYLLLTVPIWIKGAQGFQALVIIAHSGKKLRGRGVKLVIIAHTSTFTHLLFFCSLISHRDLDTQFHGQHRSVQRSAKVDVSGCVNAAAKMGQM